MAEAVSILICTHDRAAILARTLESLTRVRGLAGSEHELVVVGNACTDATASVVAEWAPRVGCAWKYVEEPRVGLSHARNRAASESRSPILAFLDDDVWVEEEWLEGLLGVYASTPASMVAGRVDLWWEAVERPAWFTPLMDAALSTFDRGPEVHELREPDAVGANFSMRRRALEDAGPFSPEFGRVGSALGAGEESHVLMRAMAKGHRLFTAPGCGVKHWVAPGRATPGYVAGASRGYARAIVTLMDRFGPLTAVKTLLTGAGRVLWFTPVGWAGRIMGSERVGNHALVRRAVGLGQLEGVWARLRRGSGRPGSAAVGAGTSR
jgi:hypothetical protein